MQYAYASPLPITARREIVDVKRRKPILTRIFCRAASHHCFIYKRYDLTNLILIPNTTNFFSFVFSSPTSLKGALFLLVFNTNLLLFICMSPCYGMCGIILEGKKTTHQVQDTHSVSIVYLCFCFIILRCTVKQRMCELSDKISLSISFLLRFVVHPILSFYSNGEWLFFCQIVCILFEVSWSNHCYHRYFWHFYSSRCFFYPSTTIYGHAGVYF